LCIENCNEKSKNIYIPNLQLNKLLEKKVENKKIKTFLEKYSKNEEEVEEEKNIEIKNNDEYDLKISNLNFNKAKTILESKLSIIQLPFINRIEQVI
jgi:hypothetical protein